jgi:outer membrane protein TolC
VRAELRHALRPIAALATLALVSSCGVTRTLSRPEGNGGWTAEKRRDELAQRAKLAGVSFPAADSAGSAPPSAKAPAVASNVPLTLADALALAATGNRRIAESAKQVERAREQVWNTRGRLLPSTTASGRYTWYTDPLTNEVVVPGGIPGGGTASVTIREDEAATLNATVTLPFDLSGELRSALAAAQAGYRGEVARRWSTILAAEVDVVSAYLDLLQAERLREVTEQTIAAERRQLQSAEARYTGGRTTKNDLLVVQVRLLGTEQRLLSEDLLVARSRWALNQAVGLPVDAPTTVVDVTDAPRLPTIEDALATTFEENPLIVGLLEEQQRLESTVASLERSRLPRFAGAGAMDWTSSDVVEPQDVGSALVGFTWDLGTDWRRESDIAAAKAASKQNEIVIEREMRALEAGVRLASLAVEERLAALAAARASISQAEENLRIREQQFDVGRATSDDVLEAVTLLARERAIAATALYQAHARAAELHQLMGTSLDAAIGGGQ